MSDHNARLTEALTTCPYHRMKKILLILQKRKLKLFQWPKSFRCGLCMLWFRYLLFITLLFGVWGILWFQCTYYVMLLRCAPLGRQKILPGPLQCVCFQLETDGVKDQCQPSVDILICHGKKWCTFVHISRLFKNKEQWELLNWAIWVLSSIYTLFFLLDAFFKIKFLITFKPCSLEGIISFTVVQRFNFTVKLLKYGIIPFVLENYCLKKSYFKVMIVMRKRYETRLQKEKMITSPVMSSSEPFPRGF